ncbi:hypothetical protein BC829DRAFT_382106 [Chytridium lagenaria]|nr:hypothetical protein BC829DRAFT_382106 [Chytridium lagenaria]
MDGTITTSIEAVTTSIVAETSSVEAADTTSIQTFTTSTRLLSVTTTATSSSSPPLRWLPWTFSTRNFYFINTPNPSKLPESPYANSGNVQLALSICADTEPCDGIVCGIFPDADRTLSNKCALHVNTPIDVIVSKWTRTSKTKYVTFNQTTGKTVHNRNSPTTVNIGLIIGVAIGSFLLIVIVVLSLVKYKMKRRQMSKNEQLRMQPVVGYYNVSYRTRNANQVHSGFMGGPSLVTYEVQPQPRLPSYIIQDSDQPNARSQHYASNAAPAYQKYSEPIPPR